MDFSLLALTLYFLQKNIYFFSIQTFIQTLSSFYNMQNFVVIIDKFFLKAKLNFELSRLNRSCLIISFYSITSIFFRDQKSDGLGKKIRISQPRPNLARKVGFVWPLIAFRNTYHIKILKNRFLPFLSNRGNPKPKKS